MQNNQGEESVSISFNTFDGGLNKNVSPKNLPANQYFDAKDVTVFKNNEFGSLSTIHGTDVFSSLISPVDYSLPADFFQSSAVKEVINCLGINECNLTVNGNKVKSYIVVLSRPHSMVLYDDPEEPYVDDDEDFEVFANDYDGGTNQLVVSKSEYLEIYFIPANDGDTQYLAYQELFTSPIHRGKTADIIISGADNVEIIFVNTQAVSPFMITANEDLFPLTKGKIHLLPFENMNPPVASITSGGSILSGTYSFVTRLYDSETRKFTKFSLPSFPILISSDIASAHNSSVSLKTASIGSSTANAISLTCSFNPAIGSDFDYFQVGIIKNTTGTGLTKEVLSLSPLILKTDPNSATYLYATDDDKTVIESSDVFIDKSPVDIFNSIDIKDNVFLGGGVTYKDLTYDNGDIAIHADSGYKIHTVSMGAGDYGNPIFNSNVKYYFRDELYRVAITYHDAFGNWSDPFILDMSVCTNNYAASGIDFKFPPIFQEPILTASNNIRAISLYLKGIQNHPSWSKGFAILRAERIKDIQFQTPLISSMAVMPLETTALIGDASYPQNGDPVAADAQPASNPLGTLIPKNLQDIVPKHIIRGNLMCQYKYGYDSVIRSQHPGLYTYTPETLGDKDSIAESAAHVHFVFPPNNIYNNAGVSLNPYAHNNGDFLDLVDIQNTLIEAGYLTQDEQIIEDSEEYIYHLKAQYYTNTSLRAQDNFCNSGKDLLDPDTISLMPVNNKILEHVDIPYGEEGTVVISSIPSFKSNILVDNKNIRATGINEGVAINSHKIGAIITANPIIDINYKAFDNVSAVAQATINGLTGTGETPIFVETTSLTDQFTNNNAWISDVDDSKISLLENVLYTNPSRNKFNFNSTYIKFPIVNIKKGLSDARYGTVDNALQFVFTGAYQRLSDADVADNVAKDIDVFGGDCTYDLHTFKLNENTYYVPDANKGTTVDEQKRVNGASFINRLDDDNLKKYEVGRPLSNLVNVQHVSVFLESEIPATYLDRRSANRFKKVNNVHTVPVAGTVGDAKTPWPYQFNLDIAKSFSDKVWVKQPDYISDNNKLFSRIHYSDPRIYQSDIIGFDQFRAGNYYDLNEAYGSITQLLNSNNNTYAITERSIQYLPIFSNTIESADGVTLAVRSQDVIGTPRILSSISGTNLKRSVSVDDSGFYFIDSNQDKLMYVSGTEIFSLNGNLDVELSNIIRDSKGNKPNSILTAYDYNQQELYLFIEYHNSTEGKIFVFSKRNKTWVTQLSASDYFSIVNGKFAHGELVFLGLFSDENVNINKINQAGNSLKILGADINPSVSFFVNKDPLIPKVFDNFNINSDIALRNITIETFNTFNDNASQNVGMNIDSNNKKQGSYRIPILRHNNQRIRGLYGKVKLDFPIEDDEILLKPSLFSVLTKYRTSERRI